MTEPAMLFDCTGAGTVVDEWSPLFPPGDVVGHVDHPDWLGTVLRTSRPEAHGRHHFHVHWHTGPRGVREYAARELYRIQKAGGGVQ